MTCQREFLIRFNKQNAAGDQRDARCGFHVAERLASDSTGQITRPKNGRRRGDQRLVIVLSDTFRADQHETYVAAICRSHSLGQNYEW